MRQVMLAVAALMSACGGPRVGALDGDWSASVEDRGLAVACGGDSSATMSGLMAVHEDPPGVLSGNVLLCGERAAVLGQVDAAGGFELSVADFGLLVTAGNSSSAGLEGSARTPRGAFRFAAQRAR
jgi:hypothetical protein